MNNIIVFRSEFTYLSQRDTAPAEPHFLAEFDQTDEELMFPAVQTPPTILPFQL